MDISLPSRDALKAQAKRLRAHMQDQGRTFQYAAALEAIAHQWGARDWNTLCAMSGPAPRAVYAPGQIVSGRYLGQPFRGHIKSADQQSGGYWRLTLRFDAPVDVVRSVHFSALRQQVRCTVDGTGQSPQKTSDGVAQMRIDDHWSSP